MESVEELRAIVASNLIQLRTAAGMTQSDLGQKINYSDKSISKWERADAIPDVYVLKQLADIFHVDVDYFIETHDEVRPKLYNEQDKPEYSTNAIIAVTIAGIWSMATLAFALSWIFGHIFWQFFVIAVPLSLIVYLIFHSIWNAGRKNYYIISALVLSLILLIYLMFLSYNPWQLLLTILPSEAVVFLCFRIKKHRHVPKD